MQIHPCSVNFALQRFDSRVLVYHEKVQTSQIWLRDCTAVGALPLLLFGGEVARQAAASTVTIDGWLKLDCAPKVAVLLAELRARLDRLLQVRAQGGLACIHGLRFMRVWEIKFFGCRACFAS